MQQTFTVTIDRHDRIDLPAELCRALGVGPGDKVWWVIDESEAWMINTIPTLEQAYRVALVRKASTVDDDQPQNRQRIAELFRQLQESDAFRKIVDPIAWQRDQRKERSLPGRSGESEP